MADIEKVIKGVFEMLQRNTWKDIDPERDRFQPVLNDVLELMKEQQNKVDEIIDIKRGISGKGMHELTDYEQGQVDGLRIALEILTEQT